MFIDQYYTESSGNVLISRQQASHFAKAVADDFNPLHDIETKKFCVPGDLLFSLVLSKYGVSERMRFTFSDMVTDETNLKLPTPAPHMTLHDGNGKDFLDVQREGNTSTDKQLIDNLIHSYVSFSGTTFPHVLIPLLKEKGVMINPQRPLVIYQSMLIDLQQLEFSEIDLQLDTKNTVMDVNGKRGKAHLAFNLFSEGELVGRGQKRMVLTGLKAFEETAVNALVDEYIQRKNRFNYPSEINTAVSA